MQRLYHGTSILKALKLKAGGSYRRPLYVTRYRNLAALYAFITAAEQDSTPSVVVVHTNKKLHKDLEHAPIPSDKAYYIEEGIEPSEVVGIQTNPHWQTLFDEYKKTGIVDEELL